MTKYTKHTTDDDGWTGWYLPNQEFYRMRCCDCKLTHQVRFKIEDGLVYLNIKRDNRATAQSRKNLTIKE